MKTDKLSHGANRFFRWNAWFRAGLLVAVILAGIIPTESAFAMRYRRSSPEWDAQKYGAIVVDAATGQVLMNDHADRQLHPASLTKLMTLLLTFDALASGQLRASDYIRISDHAADQPPSKLGIRPGGRIRVDDAIRAVAIKSANDIAVALAESLGGSESRFAQRMTARAREIGMTRTHFVNASGLHSAFQVSSPRDMAVLARYIITTYPSYYKYFSLRSFNYAGRSHPNHNRLMNSYYGMDGMKTGYVNASGFNLVASAKRNGRRLIGVIFGGRTAMIRNAHMARMLDVAFAAPSVPQRSKTDVAQITSPPEGSGRGDTDESEEDAEDMAQVRPESGVTQSTPPIASPMASKTQVRVKSTQAPTKGKTTLHVRKAQETRTKTLALNTPSRIERDSQNAHGWAVQIGTYTTRDATDAALYQAARRLPARLSHAVTSVAPFKSSQDGWVFRARLGNLTKAEAGQVCQIFSGCTLVPPQQN